MNSTDTEIKFRGRAEYIYKVIVIGDPTVETSSLYRFGTKQFHEAYLPPVGVNIVKKQLDLEDRDVTVILLLWNIVCQPQFYTFYYSYFKNADGLILVFDINSPGTFRNINHWYSVSYKHRLGGIPKILVGIRINQKDERKVSKSVAEDLSKKLHASYLEISPVIEENIDHIFHRMAKLIYSGFRTMPVPVIETNFPDDIIENYSLYNELPIHYEDTLDKTRNRLLDSLTPINLKKKTKLTQEGEVKKIMGPNINLYKIPGYAVKGSHFKSVIPCPSCGASNTISVIRRDDRIHICLICGFSFTT